MRCTSPTAAGTRCSTRSEGAAKDLEKLLQQEAKKDTLKAAAETAVSQALADAAVLAQLVAETLYLENEHLQAANPKIQDKVDRLLADAKQKLASAKASLSVGDYGGAIAEFQRAWDLTQKAIAAAQ